MQVEVNVLSMHNNFDGCCHFGFGDIATFKNGLISLPTMDYSSMVIKKFIRLESAQKIHASRGQCTPTLMGVAIPVSEILLLSKTTKFPFPTMDYSPWSSKNLIIWNRLRKNHASRGKCIVHAHQF